MSDTNPSGIPWCWECTLCGEWHRSTSRREYDTCTQRKICLHELREGRPQVSASALPAFIDTVPDLLKRLREQPPPAWLVQNMIPALLTILLHGQPRELKSLTAIEILLAVATGRPAFGLLPTGEPAPVWYVTEEDGEYHVADRLSAMLAGAGLETAPETLHSTIGKGVNLDDPAWQDDIVAAAAAQRYRLVTFDPLRSLTAGADQGPRELKPVITFTRRLIREAGCSVLFVHHDTKPGDKPDTRRRPQRASGGGIFSIADAPIHVESLDAERRLLVPTAYKFSPDPPAITLTLESGDGWLRLVGEHASGADDNAHAALDQRIVEFLRHSPYTYSNKVAAGVKASKSAVLARLKQLEAAGVVDSIQEDRGIKWIVTRKAAA